MKSIIPLLLLLLFVFSSTFSFSQNSISFTYDANGNRIIRRILDMTMENLETTDTTNYQEEILDEILEEKLTIEDEIGDTKISFFPNPVKQWLNIKISLPANGTNGSGIGEYTLYNNVGKLLDQGRLNTDNRLNLNNYTSGLYLLEIEIDGKKQVWKILKD